MRLVTRAALGWPASAAPLQAVTQGVKVHYEGTPVSTKLLTDHAACIAEWRAIRKSHLANTKENYSDIAYNYAACPHGYLLEGRGIGKRTGANGNQELNRAHYAIVGLVGDEGLTEPTDAMLGAIRDGIDLLRRNGAGTEIKGHRDGYATECPGGPLYAWVQKGAPRPITEEDDVALTTDDINKIAVATVNHLLSGGGVLEGGDVTRVAAAVAAKLQPIEAAQTATIDKLVGAVATLAANVGGLDPAAIVAELRQAIESITIHLDVPDA
jgi:hypothetical protein